MKHFSLFVSLLTLSVGTLSAQSGYPFTQVPFTSVKIAPNTFWGDRIQAAREVTIPLAFSKCESEHRYKNFEMAAYTLQHPGHPGLQTPEWDVAKFMGFSFDDTDVYKTIEGASYVLRSQETGDRSQERGEGSFSFIANGDRAVVQRVRHVHELYGFRFAEVTMQFPDYDDYELTAIVILDSLTTETPALTREQQEQLYNAVLEDYSDIPRKADQIKKLKEDRYYNALQVKFAYAVTCHKAQGGQWAHIYLDQGYMTDEMLSSNYIHWLYTAFTRATEKLFLVNWPKTQLEESGDGSL